MFVNAVLRVTSFTDQVSERLESFVATEFDKLYKSDYSKANTTDPSNRIRASSISNYPALTI